jgi:chromosome partitioning protein
MIKVTGYDAAASQTNCCAQNEADVIKIVVNSPKGGVGKTTIAMNTALYLARRHKRVWALDLAQGGLMTDQLRTTEEFSGENPHNRLDTQELGELPLEFPGSRKFAYLVADTDDYFKILENLLDEKRRGWRVITPILAGDYNGLERIPKEIRVLMTGGLLLGERPILRIIINRCAAVAYEAMRAAVSKHLTEHGIVTLLADSWIPEASFAAAPYFINETAFADSVRRMLSEIGIIL